MNTASSETYTFVVSGLDLKTSRGAKEVADAPLGTGFETLRGNVKHSVRLTAARASREEHKVVASEGDVVLLHLSNGPSLVLYPKDAYDLLRAQSNTAREDRSGEQIKNSLNLPVRLQWSGLERAAEARGTSRGLTDGVSVDAIEVLGDFLGGKIKTKATHLIVDELAKYIDGRVEEGVYQLDDKPLGPLKGTDRFREKLPASTKPILVLIHGTFVDTESTFGKLWGEHPRSA